MPLSGKFEDGTSHYRLDWIRLLSSKIYAFTVFVGFPLENGSPSLSQIPSPSIPQQRPFVLLPSDFQASARKTDPAWPHFLLSLMKPPRRWHWPSSHSPYPWYISTALQPE